MLALTWPAVTFDVQSASAWDAVEMPQPTLAEQADDAQQNGTIVMLAPEVSLAEYIQPEPSPPATSDNATTPRTRTTPSDRQPRRRPSRSSTRSTTSDDDPYAFLLADAPPMHGHYYNSGGSVGVVFWHGGDSLTNDLPLAGACGRLTIAENNKALPEDRIYFTYNRFNGAMQSFGTIHSLSPAPDFVGPSFHERASVDRYTFGIEKTLGMGNASIEFRMPFSYREDYAYRFVEGGDIGNLGVITKFLAYESDRMSIVSGIGLETPTGSNVEFFRDPFTGNAYTLQNQAYGLEFYVGMLRCPEPRFFYQGFLQLSLPLNGNRIVAPEPVTDPSNILDAPTLLHLDGQAGAWLLRRELLGKNMSVAAVMELHYVTTVSRVDEFSLSHLSSMHGEPISMYVTGAMSRRSEARGSVARNNTADLTLGIHTLFQHDTAIRIAAVLPLQGGENRILDSEIIVQLERKF